MYYDQAGTIPQHRLLAPTRGCFGRSTRGGLHMRLKVRDVYARNVITVTPNTPMLEARRLMDGNNIRRLPVILGDELLGIVTLTDLMRAAPSPASSLSVWEVNYLLDKITVAELMTSPAKTVTPDADLYEVAKIMLKHKIGGLPVVDDGKLVGIVTESDIFRVMARMLGEGAEQSEADVDETNAEEHVTETHVD